jgi:Virulence-associated protein E/RepB DNA-primase from phage plasmid
MSSDETTNTECLKVDVEEALDFLQNLCGSGNWHLTAIIPDGAVRNRTFGPSERGAAADSISTNSGIRNIYVHVNTLKEGIKNVKAKKEHIAAAAYVHIDIDDADGRERVKAFAIPPTAIVASGGGYNAYWKLTEPLADIEAAESINRWLVQELNGDSAATDVSRILRVPGTMNLPTKKKLERGRVPVMAHVVKEMTDWTLAYPAEQFGKVELPKSASKGKGLISKKVSEVAEVAVRDLPDVLDERLVRVALTGDDPERPRGKEDARYPSRSEAVFAVACGLGRAGLSAEEIAGVLINPALGISASILEKRNPRDEALRQATKALLAIGDDWPDGVQPKTGIPNSGFQNTQAAILRLGIVCRFDVYRNRMTVSGQVLQQFVGDYSDRISLFVRDLIGKHFGFDPGNERTNDSIVNLCSLNMFDPVRDYLDSLKWDGVSRINKFLIKFCGADDSVYTEAVSAITFIAAVRRVRSPGIKFDTIPVWEGVQGSGKSTAIKILASSEFFSDQDLLALDQKAQMEVMEGVWIFEICELAGMRHTEVNKIKAFASRSTDKARPAYGRVAEIRPRRGILIGTTNDDEYLKDETGNRRFWPVATDKIDLPAIAAVRDQLWAEAAIREANGESITLPETLWVLAAVEQAKRVSPDPWADTLTSIKGIVLNGREIIATQYLLTQVLNIRSIENNNYLGKRLARVMRGLGWNGSETLTFRYGQKAKGYWRTSTLEDDPAEDPI